MNNTKLLQQKAEIRQKLKQIRSAIPEETRKAHTAIIYNHLLAQDEVTAAQSLFIYISYGSEVGTHELINYFLNEGKILAVPKIINSDHMIAVPFTSWDNLTAGQLGILTPNENSPFEGNIDVSITPGVGFSKNGHRIGYGKGYYDQWFAEYKVPAKIAIAFETQLVDELPFNEHDIPVDKIVTEKGVIQP